MAPSPEIAAAIAKKNAKYSASCAHARATHAHESRQMTASSRDPDLKLATGSELKAAIAAANLHFFDGE